MRLRAASSACARFAVGAGGYHEPVLHAPWPMVVQERTNVPAVAFFVMMNELPDFELAVIV